MIEEFIELAKKQIPLEVISEIHECVLDNVDVYSFPQVWSSPPNDKTKSQIFVVVYPLMKSAVVFSDKPYFVKKINKAFWQDLSHFSMLPCENRNMYEE